MEPLELIDVDGEVGIIFPEELCASLRVGLGDDVHLTPTTHGFALHSGQTDTKILFQKTHSATDSLRDGIA